MNKRIRLIPPQAAPVVDTALLTAEGRAIMAQMYRATFRVIRGGKS